MNAASSHNNIFRNITSDDIQLAQYLGRGSYGEAYTLNLNNRKVAVKRFRMQIEKNYFDTEVEQLSRVDHINIIKFFGVSEHSTSKYIILEYADGGSLHEFLHGAEKREYDFNTALSWAQQCAEGVAYLHSMHPKVLHRDLKPANLLLTHNYTQIRICDFGTVAETKSRLRKGTPAYTAPEVYKGVIYNEKSDVFSWGILTWEILSREVPFNDALYGCVITDKIIKGERPRLIDNWPRNIKSLINSAWDKNSRKRPTMREIARNLHAKGNICPIEEHAPKSLDFTFWIQKIFNNI